MEKIDVAAGIFYLDVPEEGLRILCGCPENSIKFIMQKGLTPAVSMNGITKVEGPNAILLNDISILNSHYLNFAEFPVLHHQYFQGAAYNGSNEKFILIGIESRVANQQEYIRRGIQGLTSYEELMEADLSDDIAEKLLALGNYNRGWKNEFNVIKPVYIHNKTCIKGELYIERLSLNKFRFKHNEQSEVIDLNLPKNAKGVGLPYSLEHKYVPLEDFSITTVGDGNGWNPKVPCMGCLITVRGKKYLVDSGPGSLDLLRFLGTTPSELDGIFVTHSHDDHFAGILSLLNAENKMKFFATSVVKTSIQKKFQSLLNVNKEDLKKYIDFIDLKEDCWIDVGGMEVKANYSFHTVETNIYYFRVLNNQGQWKTYGHITDIISKKDLDKIIKNDKSGIIKKEWAYQWFEKYLETCDLKKIDAGGGVIHGDSHDFISDKSSKIILSHLDRDIDTSESPNFYKPTDFGHTEVLIKSKEQYLKKHAQVMINEIGLGEYKKDINDSDIVLYGPHEVIYSFGDKLDDIYLVVTGQVEAYDTSDYVRKYIKGDFLYTFKGENKSKKEFKTSCFTNLLKIDRKCFFKFIKKLKLKKEFLFLRNTTLFSYGFSFHTLLKLSNLMERVKVKKGSTLNIKDNSYYFVEQGSVDIICSGKKISKVTHDQVSVYSYNTDLCPRDNKIEQITAENSIIIKFNRDDIYRYVSFMWSIFEEFRKIETIVEIGRI